jgi:spore coat polysaccharide biosynthesis protein SpsF
VGNGSSFVDVRAVIQARMGSQRFPGKVLAPLRGEPVIIHVVRAVADAIGEDNLVVATSDEPADDPLALYLESLAVPCFRGPCDDVLERFRRCVLAYPCDWVLRICADSPRLDPEMVRAVVQARGDGSCDLVSTIFPRTFPKGQDAELVRSGALLELDGPELTADDREHVTPFFYRHADRYVIRNVESGDPALAQTSVAVDTVEDLRRLEELA